MKIHVENPGFWFALFYILSFTVTFIIILVAARKKNVPLGSVLLMLTATSILTVIGSRLICIPAAGWKNITSIGSLAGYENRSALGGLVFGLAGLILTQRFFRLGREIIDIYAWVAPLGFGIQKIGCFFNGCCFGRVTALPWGVSYGYGSSAHFHQWVSGIIEENAPFSASVHPVQLYETLFFFLISFLAWKAIRKWKGSYSSLLFSTGVFFVFRFIAEFFRDPSGSSFNTSTFTGMRWLQWFILLAAAVCLLLLLASEKLTKLSCLAKVPEKGPSLVNLVAYIGLICSVLYIFRNSFSPFESVSIYMKFIPALALTCWCIFSSARLLKWKILSFSIIALPLFVSTRTFLQDSAKSGGTLRDFYQNKVTSYRRIDAGFTGGNAFNVLQFNPLQGQCGTSYTENNYRHEFRSGGAGYSVVRKAGNKIITKGINLYGGFNREINLTSGTRQSNFIGAVNPYIKADFEWIGIGLGAHVGELRWIPSEPLSDIQPTSGTNWSPILPEVYLRLGESSVFDVRYIYGYKFPSTLPMLNSEISFGTGFGNKTNLTLRYGLDFSSIETNSFLYGEALVSKQVGFMFKYSFGNSKIYNTNTSGYFENSIQRFVFGLNYRFGFNSVKDKNGKK
ncbi:MAG TPA: prolipoprotein diacylglyceryl transferase family protein [Bacteroidales bacterium]|nr:prolipoprotein diacylglyceryl transferase family protein [Bacteroidales bacterium]